MSQAVLISIKPEWVELIMAGQKITEIRKVAPKLETPFDMYIYECGTGHVVGMCKCTGITEYNMNRFGVELLSRNSCVPKKQIHEYAGAKPSLFGWGIRNAIRFDEPKKLSEFGLSRPPQSWCYVDI